MDLQLFSSLRGQTVSCTRGPAGKVRDLLVDDCSWLIRGLVLQQGSWFYRRPVTVDPALVSAVDTPRGMLYADATWPGGSAAANRPQAATGTRRAHRPGSTYCSRVRPGDAGATSASNSDSSGVSGEDVYGIGLQNHMAHRNTSAPRSLTDISDCRVRATDGVAGYVEDILVETTPGAWRMVALVVGQGIWPWHRQALLRPESFGWMSCKTNTCTWALPAVRSAWLLRWNIRVTDVPSPCRAVPGQAEDTE